MPIDPREIAGAKPGFVEVITSDRLCHKCGYSLKGLPTNGKCPECGRPIVRRTRGAKRFTDNLTEAALFYLKALATGAILLAACSVVSAVALGVFEASGSEVAAGIAGAGAVGWWIGVFICTSQRPMEDGTIRDVFLESVWLRAVNRVVQLAWAGAVLAYFAAARVPAPGAEIATWVGRGLYVIGLLGLVPLSVQLSSLGDWAGDTALAERFRISASLMTICGTLWVGGQVVDISGWEHWTSYLVRIPAKWATLGLSLAQCFFLWYLVQLAYICGWAINNSVTASAMSKRQVKRASDPLARGPCSQCGYDMSGLGAFARCPECGHLDESVRQSGLVPLAMARDHTPIPVDDSEIPLVTEAPKERPKVVSPAPIGVGRRWGEQGQAGLKKPGKPGNAGGDHNIV